MAKPRVGPPQDANEHAGQTVTFQGESWASVPFGSRGYYKWMRANDPRIHNRAHRSPNTPTRRYRTSRQERRFRSAEPEGDPGFVLIVGEHDLPSLLRAEGSSSSIASLLLDSALYDLLRSETVDARHNSRILRDKGDGFLEIAPRPFPLSAYLDQPSSRVNLSSSQRMADHDGKLFVVDYLAWQQGGFRKFPRKLNPKSRYQELIFYRRVNPSHFWIHLTPDGGMVDGLLFTSSDHDTPLPTTTQPRPSSASKTTPRSPQRVSPAKSDTRRSPLFHRTSGGLKR